MTEVEFAEKIAAAGGRAFAVGGWVRDFLRGSDPKDKDYVVTGLNQEILEDLFPEGELIGRSFPVFLLDIDGEHCEVAAARRERKIGVGYRGFAAEADKSITIEEDLYRRDLTVNSLAIELATNEVVDPYGGRRDLAAGVLRPVSEHFTEDPVRALRAARFAAQLGFRPLPELIKAMQACRTELLLEPVERIFTELKKALVTAQPSLFFRTLQEAGLLADVFPEIYALIGKTQPEFYHPEGDAFEHVMEIVDKVAQKTDNIVARFAALCHDLGKGVTPPEMLPHHYGHEFKGLVVLDAWNERMTLPVAWRTAASFVMEQHMRAARLSKAQKILEFLLKLEKISAYIPISDVKIIINADNKGLPFYIEKAEDGLAAIHKVSGKDAPFGLKGEAVGAWLHSQQVALCKRWLASAKHG